MQNNAIVSGKRHSTDKEGVSANCMKSAIMINDKETDDVTFISIRKVFFLLLNNIYCRIKKEFFIFFRKTLDKIEEIW